jgi:hypothetical protein
MSSSEWPDDPELGSRFGYKTLFFEDDYDGPVTATLVRNKPCLKASKPAILYLHGFIRLLLPGMSLSASTMRGTTSMPWTCGSTGAH